MGPDTVYGITNATQGECETDLNEAFVLYLELIYGR